MPENIPSEFKKIDNLPCMPTCNYDLNCVGSFARRRRICMGELNTRANHILEEDNDLAEARVGVENHETLVVKGIRGSRQIGQPASPVPVEYIARGEIFGRKQPVQSNKR